MLEKVKILCRYMMMLNADGMKILCEAARDISAHKKYRRADGKLTPEQFDRSVNVVLAMVKRNWEDKQCQDTKYLQGVTR